MTKTSDPVNPQHYRNASGVQVIEVIRWLPFSLGNAVKYAYRNEQKENAKQDLEKALWYLSDFLEHPTVVEEARDALNPALIEAVFSGVNFFEKAACLSLLHLHELALSGESLEVEGQVVKELLEARLNSIGEAASSAAPTLF